MKYLIILFALAVIPYIVRLHVTYHECQKLFNDASENVIVRLSEIESVLENDMLFLQNYCVVANGKIDSHVILEKLNRAIRLSPSNTLYRMKGDCLLWMKQYEEAEKAYWTAHYMAPSQQRARARLISLYVEEKRISEAKELASVVLNEQVKINGLDAFILHEEIKRIISSIE